KNDLDAAFAVLTANGSTVETLASSLVLATSRPDEAALAAAANALIAKFGRDVKIVCGSADCLVGLVGSGNVFRYATLIPGFNDVLRTLAELPDGECRTL